MVKRHKVCIVLWMLCVLFIFTGNIFASGGLCLNFLPHTNIESTKIFSLSSLPLLPPDSSEFSVTACGEYLWHEEYIYESGDYTHTFINTSQEDSVVILHLTILPRTSSELTVHSCGPYMWGGIPWTQSGEYRMRFTASNGCDSTVTLYLTVHEPTFGDTTAVACERFDWYEHTNITESCDTLTHTFTGFYGCDSIVTLHLDIQHPTQEIISDTIQNSELPYVLNDSSYYQAGTYIQHLNSTGGCDSTLTLVLTVVENIINLAFDTICAEELPFFWNGILFQTAGEQQVMLTSSSGSDSLVLMTLTVNTPNHQSTTQSACSSFLWNGITYTQSGTYIHDHPDVNGCTQVDTLHLTIFPTPNVEFSYQACGSYTWNEQTYTTSGDYTQQFQTTYGCDSIVTLHLTIFPAPVNEFEAQVCGNYNWNDQIYTTSGDYTQLFHTSHGCDSMVTLHLTIFPSETISIAHQACDNYTWNGQTYTQSGDFTQVLTNSFGCDSTVTLHLTISHSDTTEFSETACQSYTWNNITYDQSGDYTQTLSNSYGCDSVVTLHLTIFPENHIDIVENVCDSLVWEGQTLTQSGDYSVSYTNIFGCDSIITLHLTVIHTSLEIATPDEDFCSTWSMEIFAESEMTNYLWSTGDVTSSITVESPGLYSVTASDGECLSTASYEIKLCQVQLFLPNAITPSTSDGLNDYFMIPEISQKMLSSVNVCIYNRWGGLVYHSVDKNFKWDGRCDGNLFPNTIYNYTIQYTDFLGRKYLIKGSVTVL